MTIRPDKKAKIAIIGAGPGGISAAIHLKEKGYRNVTLFESGEIGGKSQTVELEGQKFEFGTVVSGKIYKDLYDMAHQAGLRFDVLKGQRLIYDSESREMTLFDDYRDRKYSLLEYMKGSVNLWRVFAKFNRELQAGFEHTSEDLALPVSQLAVKYGFEAALHRYEIFMVAVGYAYFDQVPAWYNLKLMLMLFPGFAAQRLGNVLVPHFVTTHQKPVIGWQAMWERLVEFNQLDVRVNHPVEKVSRRDDGGGFLMAKGQRHEFDKLIVTCDLKRSLSILDSCGDERRLFGMIEHRDYIVSAIRFKRAAPQASIFFRRNIGRQQLGKVVALHNPHKKSKFMISYQLIDRDLSLDRAKKLLLDEIQEMGMEVNEVVLQKQWLYFPHVAGNRLRAFHGGMARIQGQRGTYYSGGVMNFETVEHVARYSRHLVERHF